MARDEGSKEDLALRRIKKFESMSVGKLKVKSPSIPLFQRRNLSDAFNLF